MAELYSSILLPAPCSMADKGCPICSSIELASSYETPKCLVRRCAGCGHLFTDLETITQHENYDSDYYDVTHRNWFENPHTELFSAICKQVSCHLPAHKSGRRFSLLDVGCGKGQFLDFASNYFGSSFCLEGVDLCELPSDFRNIHFTRSSLDEYVPQALFDVVVSTLVIEHVPSPDDYFAKLLAFTKPGGIIIIVTNDVQTPLYGASFILRRLGFTKPFDRLFDPHHLNHFSRKALRRAATNVGLQTTYSSGHSMPLRSLDIPSDSAVQAILFPVAVKALFELGRLVRHPFLQLQIFSVQ